MRLILDTHTFLWFIEGSLNLSDTVKTSLKKESIEVKVNFYCFMQTEGSRKRQLL